jgi:catechol 2,3-dioxygenase
VSEALYFRDSEGNGVEMYCDQPRTEWPVDAEGHVEMATLPLDTDDLWDHVSGTQTVPFETTVGHVHLEVSSLSQSRAFYADALGLRVRQQFGLSALFLSADDYHHHLGLNTWNERSEPPRNRGLAWFEFVVPTDTAFASMRDRLETRGATTTPTDDGFEVADPDGIRLRVRVKT